MEQQKTAPIIEDGKTLDELIANCPTDIRLATALRWKGWTDEEIWEYMMAN